jgi:hypothetical protein
MPAHPHLSEDERAVLEFAGAVQQTFNRDVASNLVQNDRNAILHNGNFLRPERLVDPRKFTSGHQPQRRYPAPPQNHPGSHYPPSPQYIHNPSPPVYQEPIDHTSIPIPAGPPQFFKPHLTEEEQAAFQQALGPNSIHPTHPPTNGNMMDFSHINPVPNNPAPIPTSPQPPIFTLNPIKSSPPTLQEFTPSRKNNLQWRRLGVILFKLLRKIIQQNTLILNELQSNKKTIS